MKNLLFILGVLFLISCNNMGNNSSNAVDGNDYKLESIKGSSVQKAIKMAEDGTVIEEGFINNGVKDGEWIGYNEANGNLSSITPYMNGKLNGYYFEFDDRGYLVTQAGFINDDLDGKMTKFKYGKPTEIAHYKNGKLDGVKIQYHRNGNKQIEVEYKNGLIDGSMKYFNEDEEVMMEYTYKNGKKIGKVEINKDIDKNLK